MSSAAHLTEWLWCALGIRRIRWEVHPQGFAEPSSGLAWDGPALRSALGKALRRHVCPESLWHEPCTRCLQSRGCLWVDAFPGSAGGEFQERLATWAFDLSDGDLVTLHVGGDAPRLRAFACALDDVVAQRMGRDRRQPGQPPRWIRPHLLASDGTTALLPLEMDRALPMVGPPGPLVPGDRIVFRVPLRLKTTSQHEPPSMGDWLRLGRNRISRLLRQTGQDVWAADDPRWKALSEVAGDARWAWETGASVSPWKPVVKHHMQVEGWTGVACIEHLPDPWIPWASLLPWMGVGSHISYGAGFGRPLPAAADTVKPARPSIPLRWKTEFAS